MNIQLLKTIDAVRAWRKKAHGIAFVPTMGNLHDGHMALVEEAKKHASQVIVSIFVNPLQFGADEDLDAYPHTLSQDLAKLEKAEVSAVFTPSVKDLYPKGNQSYRINLPPISKELCGKYRPGHFEGVATVVCKLFNIVEPAISCFGEKDFQQLHIIKGLVQELDFNIKILSVPVIRDSSGLALSSRNSYLNEEEKRDAICLYQALKNISSAQCKDIFAYNAIISDEATTISSRGWQIDYLELRDAETLRPAERSDNHLVALGAIRKKGVRLIDNIQFTRQNG